MYPARSSMVSATKQLRQFSANQRGLWGLYTGLEHDRPKCNKRFNSRNVRKKGRKQRQEGRQEKRKGKKAKSGQVGKKRREKKKKDTMELSKERKIESLSSRKENTGTQKHKVEMYVIQWTGKDKTDIPEYSSISVCNVTACSSDILAILLLFVWYTWCIGFVTRLGHVSSIFSMWSTRDEYIPKGTSADSSACVHCVSSKGVQSTQEKRSSLKKSDFLPSYARLQSSSVGTESREKQ